MIFFIFPKLFHFSIYTWMANYWLFSFRCFIILTFFVFSRFDRKRSAVTSKKIVTLLRILQHTNSSALLKALSQTESYIFFQSFRCEVVNLSWIRTIPWILEPSKSDRFNNQISLQEHFFSQSACRFFGRMKIIQFMSRSAFCFGSLPLTPPFAVPRHEILFMSRSRSNFSHIFSVRNGNLVYSFSRLLSTPGGSAENAKRL